MPSHPTGRGPTLDLMDIDKLLARQSGVVARHQLHDIGLAPHDIVRLLRRQDLTRIRRGVFVNHTGQLSFMQRTWSALLAHPGSALSHEAALRCHEGKKSGRPEPRVIDLVVPRAHHAVGAREVRIHRSDRLHSRARLDLSPPRVTYEDAVLDVALAARSDLDLIAEVAKAVQVGRTTAARLLTAVDERARAPRRVLLESLLNDVASGACSALEVGYLRKVERPHGLGAARRQVREQQGGSSVYRDVEYACGTIVELDGRLFHDTATQRDADMDRDLETARQGRRTLRLSWGKVFDRPCRTAARIGAVLGAGRPCANCATAEW